MLDTLTAVHRPREKDGSDLARDQPRAAVFRTCLRQIGFLRGGELASERLGAADEVYAGKEMYRFLLEVVCGLRSPLIGEAEVLGQFKDFCLASREVQTGWSAFRHLCTRLLTDAKAIRTAHLTHLGRSYGSLARRHLSGFRSVAILGAGQLTRELLPCLLKMGRIEVVCRSKERAAALKGRFPQIELSELTGAPAAEPGPPRALVVAAPMSAAAIRSWVVRQGRPFDKILDLRGESGRDPLAPAMPEVGCSTEIVSLLTLFAELQSQRVAVEARLSAARDEIGRSALAYAEREELHPFGWEDLCA